MITYTNTKGIEVSGFTTKEYVFSGAFIQSDYDLNLEYGMKWYQEQKQQLANLVGEV